MRPPSQQSGGLHYHSSDLLAIDIPVHHFLGHLHTFILAELKYCKNINAYYFFFK